MNLFNIKDIIKRNVSNISGWRTNRKIVVIESDDWGSIRMPSKETYQSLLKSGIKVDKCPYNRYDSLESENDLNRLFDVLVSFKDLNGNHPVITANAIMTNPDFEKIRASNFNNYYCETFTETLKKHPKHTKSFEIWIKGKELGVFYPQLHGKEHLNINRWMEGLRKGLPETRLAFDHGLFGLSTTITSEKRRSYLASFDYDNIEQYPEIQQTIIDAGNMFKSIFGYKSESFIAPNYFWDNKVEEALNKIGIKIIQGSKVQNLPIAIGGGHLRHTTGELNNLNQLYTVRNCVFEPSINGTSKELDNCLAQIKTSFFWGKPAIITSHRLNYIGYINQENSDRNLKLLSRIIKTIMQKWPDVEFWNSAELGKFIAIDLNNKLKR